MNTTERPSPRPVFLETSRRLNVKFYTSNVQKYLQAKLVFERFGVDLHHFKSQVDPYTENYELGKEQLLLKAVDEVTSSIGRSSLFFVEDTSLRIDALSEGDKDVPGLAVKEWFARTTFKALNKLLPKEVAGRSATVKSDIALHVPRLVDPILFHGETSGTVAATAPTFGEDPFHPWLTPNNFNGWFIPDGSMRRLGEMSLEESWSYDFRIAALTALVSRLEEYAAILNASRDCYSLVPSFSMPADQPSLFGPPPLVVFVVVGPTCSGKTTFGQIAARNNTDLKVIEASDIVRSFRRRSDKRLTAYDFASHLLREKGPDVIARKIVNMYRMEEGGTFIITGFRTLEELETIQNVAPQAKVLLIEGGSGRTRYSRYLKRGRDPRMSYEEFMTHDKKQWAFGLLRVAEDFADVKITNEASLDVYSSKVMSVVNDPDHPIAGVSVNTRPRHVLAVHRLFRCLSILAETGRTMTCEEIEEKTETEGLHSSESEMSEDHNIERKPRHTGKRITPNNVNKILKQAPELAQRLETNFDRIRYKITDTGRAYIRLMQKFAEMRS